MKDELFRPRRLLAALMAGAALLWLLVVGYLTRFSDVPLRIWFTASLFVVFFGVAAVYYGRAAIWVDGSGFTYRGLWARRRVAFCDIERVNVLPGPLTVYTVTARRTLVHFTSLFGRHRRLFQLLMERARLEG